MKLKLCPENGKKIAAALATVNGGSHTHTFTMGSQISQEIAEEAESRLRKFGLCNSKRRGAIVIGQSGSILPSSYGYPARTTTVTLYRGVRDWFITDISESSLYPKTRPVFRIGLHEYQIESAQESMRAALGIADISAS